jgi:hypothetical protein
MSKHSPGPWRVDPDAQDERNWTTIVNDGGFVAKCRKEDAPVIAAAPELLGALRVAIEAAETHIHSEFQGTTSLDDLLAPLETGRALIARIEGGE